MTNPPEARTRFLQAIWVIFLVSLPVTSFPYLPHALGGTALVRPFAIYPLFLLLLFFILPSIWRQPLPATFFPLILFILVGLASCAVAWLRNVDPQMGVTTTARMIRALLTLGLGVSFYMTVSIFPKTPELLQSSIRWIYYGFIAALLWGTLQVVYVVHFNQSWFDLLGKIQAHISIRALIPNRVTGLTYEPSWFADQITQILMPWLLASILSGFSVFRRRIGWLTMEMLLLVWSVAVLMFTYSRSGFVVLIILTVMAVFLYRPVRGQADSAQNEKPARGKNIQRVILAVVLVAVILGLIFAAGMKNDIFARLWDYWKEDTTMNYFEFIGISPRFLYWKTAINIFAQYPLTGVGLGNYFFYFKDNLPMERLIRLPEILRLITPGEDRELLVTPKNMYLRLLSEAGFFGLAAFIAFLIAILGCILSYWSSQNPVGRMVARAGLLSWVAFVLVAFSYDTFAFPNMWVMFGLQTAAMQIFVTPKGK